MTEIKKFDFDGSLVWEKTDSTEGRSFTGQTVVDNDGNVYAFSFDVYTDITWLYKYSAAGIFLDSTSVVDLGSYPVISPEISFGFDGYIYVCGRGGGGPNADGVVSKYATNLTRVFTSYISGDTQSGPAGPLVQIRADVHGYIYTVHNTTSEKIRKYNITSGTPVKVWSNSEFDNAIPYITITKHGDMVVSGLRKLWGWADITGPSYWSSAYEQGGGGYAEVNTWDGSKWHIGWDGTYYIRELIPNGDWQQEVYEAHGGSIESPPSVQFRVTIQKGSPHISEALLDNFRVYHRDPDPDSTSRSILYQNTNLPNHTTTLEFTADGFTWEVYAWPHHPGTWFSCYVGNNNDWYDVVEITKIEVYTPQGSNCIASIDSSGEVSGVILRDKTPGIIAIDRDGNVLVQEDSTYITKVSSVSGADIWSYDTEQEVTAFVTDNTGIAAEDNSMTTNMVFTGSGFVDGTTQEIDTVWPSAAPIEFTGSADVVGHTRIITPSPAEIAFTGAGSPVVPIIVPTTDLLFESTIQVVTPILAPSAEMVFSSDVDIDGDTIVIITPPAEIVFASTDVLAYYLTAPTSGTGIYVEAGQLSFGSGDITIYTLTPDADFALEFPSFELGMNGGAFLQTEFPAFEMDAIGFIGHDADISLTFPSLSIESYAGGYVEATMPRFELVMEATVNALAGISLTFPALGFSISAAPASEGDIDITMPSLRLAMEATAGLVGELVGRFPRLGLTGTLLAGMTGQIEGSFRIMDMNMSAGPTGPGAISAEFSVFDMDMLAGAIESDVLRYNWERVT